MPAGRHPQTGPHPLETAPPTLEARGLSVIRSERTLLDAVDLDVEAGAFLGILGPNGSGKTTLLRCLAGALEASTGEVKLAARPIGSYERPALARTIGVVPQTFTLDFKFTVEEVVALGRYPHRASWGRADGRGDEAVERALADLSIEHLATRPVTELSGGEQQRVLIAQTLAQETPILLLDEPLNSLDLNHQLEVMQVLSRLNAEGKTVVVVVHDINMAAQYCADLVLLSGGRVAARGSPGTLLTPEVLLDVFSTRVTVHRQGGRPYVTPVTVSAHRTAAGAEGLRVHLITGGGAGVEFLQELVHLGFSPSLGVVSVFDSDYEAARRLGLTVVSAPPFQPLSPDTVREHEALVGEADCVVLAPQVYGGGNLAVLEVAGRALAAGATVIVVMEPRIEARDLAAGRAAALQQALIDGGAVPAPDVGSAVTAVCDLAVRAAVRAVGAGGASTGGAETDPCG
ncbi:MAG: ABC transporter ATP-binding protein [Thermoleophilia bacterium]